MKFAVLNDTHAGVRNDSIHFHEYMRKFYEEVFFPYCVENNIKHVVGSNGNAANRKKSSNNNNNRIR